MPGTKRSVYALILSFAGLVFGQTDGNSPEGLTGQLLIQGGTHITQLVLEHTTDNHRETLTEPNETLSLPVGTYRIKEVTVQDQYVYESYMQSPMEEVVITADTPQTLKVGGPLTPLIDITRQGRQLQLTYKIMGQGQETYRSLATDQAASPTFTVYQGKTVIDTGTFEYG